VKFNIAEEEAADRLQDLIREHSKWIGPASSAVCSAVSASPN